MRTTILLGGICAFFLSMAAVAGQRGGPPAGARGAGQRTAPTDFPAQQRLPGDAALIARGDSLYQMNCRLCHGPDLRGGDGGGPNLLRSQLVLNDKAGELIFPVVRDGRQNPGMSPMPAIRISQDDVRAIAEYIHSVASRSQRQGGPPPGPPISLNVLVGNAATGKTYFEARCGSCHSATGDLKGIAAKVPDAMQLQNAWLAGTMSGARGERGGRGNANPAMVTVTLKTGQKIEGTLNRIDDFIVVLNMDDDTTRSFRREGDTPKVEIRDPRDPHRNLLPEYTDKDIHDVTAYLETLK
jgi:cytochrome c oxidase cbb3-type subunit III